jgi:arginase
MFPRCGYPASGMPDPTARGPIAIIGSPTALGGHFGGMERGPEALRGARLLERLRSRAGFAEASFIDHGDVPNDPGWYPDADPFMKNRDRIIEYLPRVASAVETAIGEGAGVMPDSRLLLLGGDCTSHCGAMAGLKRRYPNHRLAIAWFDAHGDFNIPTTTPSGNVWGMPFAMLCGRGDPDLVKASDGPTVSEEDAALIGGQVLDEQESRMLAASPVAFFGAGMLAGVAGLAALEAWSRVIADRCDGLYIAFDLDAISASEQLSVAMPERGGLSVWTAVIAIRLLATHNNVLGFGATAVMPRSGSDLMKTADVVAQLAEASLGNADALAPESTPETAGALA